MEMTLEELEAHSVDDTTKAAIEQAELRDDESVPLEEVRGIVRQRYESCRKTPQEVLAAYLS